MNNKIEDTEGLWRRVKIGDEKAFDSLFEQCYSHLCNFANRILGNMAEAEETVQDAFITIWQNRHNISVTGSFKSYLYQSVHNLAINKIHHFRTLKYQPNRSADPTLWQRIHETFTIDDSLIQLLEANETEALIKKQWTGFLINAKKFLF
ncbi:MAG: sigma-70 family RNA polymerase sigma factor [Bacteroidetes bacterium]|nr:sigma-70 family RNA polymerase sigma factor [Bacteroidota bacterium]